MHLRTSCVCAHPRLERAQRDRRQPKIMLTSLFRPLLTRCYSAVNPLLFRCYSAVIPLLTPLLFGDKLNEFQ
jgi:hypothetical protein